MYKIHYEKKIFYIDYLVDVNIILGIDLINTLYSYGNVSAIINVVCENVWIAVVDEFWRHMNKHIFKGRVIDNFKFFS